MMLHTDDINAHICFGVVATDVASEPARGFGLKMVECKRGL